MQKNIVLAFVGMPGAGKSTLVEYMESKGIPNVYLGGITVDEVKRRGLPVNEANEKMVREELRATEGLGVMAMRVIPKIEAMFTNNHPTVVADGIYSWTEYKIFKEKYGDAVVIIAVAAPRRIRHERLAKRTVRPMDEAAVIAREYAEIENIEKGGPIANADYTLVNRKSPAHLIKKLDELLQELGITV